MCCVLQTDFICFRLQRGSVCLLFYYPHSIFHNMVINVIGAFEEIVIFCSAKIVVSTVYN